MGFPRQHWLLGAVVALILLTYIVPYATEHLEAPAKMNAGRKIAPAHHAKSPDQPTLAASSRSASPMMVRSLIAVNSAMFSSRLLKNVLERSGCARLIQHSGPWRTKDSAPRGPGFENCASLIPSRVFQQPARN